MKNPFKKQDHSGLIAVIAISSIAACAVAYLYLTESGKSTRKGLNKKLKEKFTDVTSGAAGKK
jgi:hypothetical protein